MGYFHRWAQSLDKRKRSINRALSAGGEFLDACVHVDNVDKWDAEQLRDIERIGGGAQAMQKNSEVLSGLVVGHKSDGRCRYDPQVKQELVRQCMMPGVPLARMTMQHGINANLLRMWITKS